MKVEPHEKLGMVEYIRASFEAASSEKRRCEERG
jgi:hypothetical protein